MLTQKLLEDMRCLEEGGSKRKKEEDDVFNY